MPRTEIGLRALACLALLGSVASAAGGAAPTGDVDRYRARGPFAVTTLTDREVRVPRGASVRMDVFLSAPEKKAPLVVFLHGHDSSRRAHAKQAEHVASWGMHSASVELPNHGPWETNGRTLARLVSTISRSPDAIDRRVDASQIILVGHSFGAYAAAVALAEGAPARGGILLDPATPGRDGARFLRRIRKPVLVLGADDDVAPARNREYFYRYMRSGVAEVSIRDAVHEDAQYPSDAALQNGGVDPETTEAHQITFASAITASALSLSATGGFGQAWTSFQPALKGGRLFNAKKK